MLVKNTADDLVSARHNMPGEKPVYEQDNLLFPTNGVGRDPLMSTLEQNIGMFIEGMIENVTDLLLEHSNPDEFDEAIDDYFSNDLLVATGEMTDSTIRYQKADFQRILAENPELADPLPTGEDSDEDVRQLHHSIGEGEYGDEVDMETEVAYARMLSRVNEAVYEAYSDLRSNARLVVVAVNEGNLEIRGVIHPHERGLRASGIFRTQTFNPDYL